MPASRICTGIPHPAKDPVRRRAHRTGRGPRAALTARHGHGGCAPTFRRPRRVPPGAGAVHAALGRSARVRAGRRTRRSVEGQSRSCTHAHHRCGGAPGVLGTGRTQVNLRSVDGPMRRPAAWAWAVPAGLRRASERRPKTPGAVPTGGTNEGCARSDARRRPCGRLRESGPSPACAWSAPPRPRRWRGEGGPLRRLAAGAMRSARCSACEGSGAARRACRLSLPGRRCGCGLVRTG